MNELVVIENKIYEIRGQKVMLDFDLAEMYEIETKNLKRTVKRNMNRFPEDFMFQLTKEEANLLINNIRCQNGTLEISWFRYQPYAFTEQGVAMLSGLLNSEKPSKSTSCEPLSTCASTCSPTLRNRNWKN